MDCAAVAGMVKMDSFSFSLKGGWEGGGGGGWSYRLVQAVPLPITPVFGRQVSPSDLICFTVGVSVGGDVGTTRRVRS